LKGVFGFEIGRSFGEFGVHGMWILWLSRGDTVN
jgi:hypothetical protein